MGGIHAWLVELRKCRTLTDMTEESHDAAQ